jgi:Protein of unknown function (DUF2735)
MNARTEQGSARIYQFPTGGRAALAGRRHGEVPTTKQTAPVIEPSICSGSWYHEAAIQDAKPAWER